MTEHKIIQGDCIEQMRLMEDNSIDSIVTDPPYELGFMGKSWDSTGIAFNVEVWAECLRVLKPGGHLLAFSGSRTYHRMAVAIEDAGFEIRDQIMWIYGSGFPKSLNIAKVIDKIEGVEPTIVGERMAQGSARKIKGTNAAANKIPNSGSLEYDETVIYETIATSDAAKQWQGWGTALKPAHEPIVLARKPLIGTVAANVLTYGTGGLNIDASRVSGEPVPINKLEEWSGFGQKIEPEYEQIMNNQGRWPANVIHDGSDEVVELFPDTGKSTKGVRDPNGSMGYHGGASGLPGVISGHTDSGTAARFFYCAKANKRDRNEGCENLPDKEWRDEGAAIPERGNRPFLPSKNNHPTVKPTDLMRYLCRLITPPNGVVLDPFMGSGSTGKAATYEGFDFIGIEQNPEYVEIAKARIEFARKKAND